MPDLPAPQHSAALNAMLGLTPPATAPPVPEAVPRLEIERHRHELRRQAASRSRARREAA